MAYRFDVAFSFAGPHREKVRAIAEVVAAQLGPEKVFFDEWYEHEILGSDMDVLLQRFYYEQSLMVVADLSDDYADRQWCQAEARAIRTLRFEIDPARDETKRLRLLDARFGSGGVPGIFKTTAYLDGIAKTVEQCAELILKRVELLRLRLGTAAPVLNKVPPAVPTRAVQEPPICWFHPATNDQLYSRREHELAWLDQCAKNPHIRIATVTGVGGLGKTSLVGHWIEKACGWQHRAFRGVFFYSFYSDRESAHFFAAFRDFACATLGVKIEGREIVLHHAAATLAQRWSFLVVLDGLEVLQADAEDSRYGWINDGELNEFVSRLGEKGQSLLVLTSRFPFPDVIRQFPEHCRPLSLAMFSLDEGADLLERCGLPEDREARMNFSAQFGGHPLALRLFAGASLTAPATDPSDLSREVLLAEKSSTLPDPDEPGITTDERQRRRHRRQFQKLLEWLQTKLSRPKRRLLQLVALFREPVPTATLAALAAGLEAMKADFFDCDPARVHSLLDTLTREHLLQREDVLGSGSPRWTAHPIVREVFRAEALKAGDKVAAQFAEIVAGKGGGGTPKTVAELKPILEAIEVLLAAGDIKAANELYIGRLENGRVFQSMPAPQEGLRCVQGFLEPRTRRLSLEQVLGRRRMAFYLNDVTLLGSDLGEMEEVERRYEEGVWICHEEGFWGAVSVRLRNLAHAQTLRGALGEAAATASEALAYSGVDEVQETSSATHRLPRRPDYISSRGEWHERNSRAYRGNALSLMGNFSAASHDFAAADEVQRKYDVDHYPLFSLAGVQWCCHYMRLGDNATARRRVEANRRICKHNRWNEDLAKCDLLLGELDLATDKLDSAAKRIGEALRVFREARLGIYLPDALLAQARLRQSVEDCEEALRLAARSGFALKQCDALNLRARLRREAGQPTDAAKDARDALEIAERCGYYWGRHEALRQLREAAKALGNRADEKHWDEAEQALAARMKPEIDEALRINREHDEEMERLYGKPKTQK